MNNESPSNKQNKSTEQMNRSNILNDDVMMEQRSVKNTVTAHNDDDNGG